MRGLYFLGFTTVEYGTKQPLKNIYITLQCNLQFNLFLDDVVQNAYSMPQSRSSESIFISIKKCHLICNLL